MEPLDPQAIDTVENTMLYIQDMSLRNQSKILIQRLDLVFRKMKRSCVLNYTKYLQKHTTI